MQGQASRIATALGLLSFALAAVSPRADAQQTPATAEAAPLFGLEEIVVTARKVEETLMSVPFSVSAKSSKDIQDMDLQNMSDISAFEPSFHFQNQTGGGSGRNDRSFSLLTFRGLALGTSATATTGSGSLFIDGSPVIDAQAPALDEVERVEVLKGPQSAYFGRSTFAGAINYVTKDPSNDFHATVNAEVSSYDSHDTFLSLEGPVVKDVLDLRVSAHNWVHGGEWLNATDTDQSFGTQETTSFATTALFTPIEKLKIKGFFNWFEDNDGPPAQAGIFASDGFFNCSFPHAQYVGGYVCGPMPNANQLNPANISGNYTLTPYFQQILVQNTQQLPDIFNPDFLDHAGLRRVAFQSDVKIDYALPAGYTLSSITAYHQSKNMEIVDLDFRDGHNIPNPFAGIIPGVLPYWAFNLAGQSEIHDLNEEVRITSPQDQRIRWNFGANYFRTFTPGETGYGIYPAGTGSFGAITSEKTETPALFGGANIDLIEQLTLSLEARYQWDDLTQTPVVNGSGVTVTGTSAGTPIKSNFKSFSPRIILDYKFIKGSSIYALWSRGYRPGGVNAILFDSSPYVLQQFASAGASLAYQQERLDNYEAGIKSTFLDGRAQVAFDGYYDLWRDGQVPVTVSFFQTPGSISRNQDMVTTNAGAIDLYGIEFTGNFQATQHLLFQTAAAINDTNVKSYSICSDCEQITGATGATGHVPGAPKYTWAASSEYTDHLFREYSWYGRIDYNHQGSFFVDYSNTAYSRPADLVNLHLGIRNDSFSLEGFMKNATNNQAPLAASLNVNVFTFLSPESQAMIRYALPDKRTLGIRVKYRF